MQVNGGPSTSNGPPSVFGVHMCQEGSGLLSPVIRTEFESLILRVASFITCEPLTVTFLR